MMVGREHERLRIDRLLDDARAGRSGALVLRGEAGIGKTALLEYAARQAGDMAILRARGLQSESELAFSGLLEVCRPLHPQLDGIPERQAAALRGALALGPAASSDRFAIGAATLSLLSTAAETQPLLVLVDDAHWLDRASADAIVFAARRLEADRVALLFAHREGERETFGLGGLEEITLSGLSRDESRKLLERAVPVVARRVADRLYALTRGNPLALLELPSSLSAAQLAGIDPWGEPVPVSATVERAFAGRAAALGKDARRALLVAASSTSGDFDEIAPALAAIGSDVTALEAAEDAGLLTLETGRVAFRHPLVRSAVVHAAAPSDRRAAHRALAQASEGDRRAWHLAAAAVGPDEEVARTLEEVARQGRERGAFAGAAAAYERSARLTPAKEARTRRLFAAAEAAWHAGATDHTLALLDEALAHCEEPRLRLDILHLRGRIGHLAGAEKAGAMLVEAASLAEKLDRRKATLVLSDIVESHLYRGDAAEMLTAARRLYSVADPSDGEEQFHANVHLGTALSLNGRPDEGLPFLRRAMEIAETSKLVGESARFRAFAALAPAWLGLNVDARSSLSEAIEWARDHDALGDLPFALRIASHLDLILGRWTAGYAAAAEAVVLARDTGQETQLCGSLGVLALLDAARGDEPACRAHALEAIELGQQLELGRLLARGEHALGLLELGLGHLNQAISWLERICQRLARGGILYEPFFFTQATDLIEAYVRSGLKELAEAELARFATVADRAPHTVLPALAARCRGLLADDHAFEREFEHALRLHSEVTHPFAEARTQLCFGERLRRAGLRRAAREQLHAALYVFEQLGATPWADRTRSELRASGERLRRRKPEAIERLTPRELQIALAVAEGKTNREAAASMFLSPKTVEWHLGRVYRKLGIDSRAELTRLLAQDPHAVATTVDAG